MTRDLQNVQPNELKAESYSIDVDNYLESRGIDYVDWKTVEGTLLAYVDSGTREYDLLQRFIMPADGSVSLLFVTSTDDVSLGRFKTVLNNSLFPLYPEGAAKHVAFAELTDTINELRPRALNLVDGLMAAMQERADLARSCVTLFGMGTKTLAAYNPETPLAQLPQEVRDQIEELLQKAYTKAQAIVEEHADNISRMADELIKKRTLTKNDIIQVWEK